jgi:hypothetical protein
VCGEARKLLFSGPGGDWLVKQLGLGARARECAQLKLRLGALGLAPLLTDVCRGFSVQAWHGDARTLSTSAGERDTLVRTLARYLTVLAQEGTANEWHGARPASLFQMLCANVQALLGQQGGHHEVLERFRARISRFEADWSPVLSDNRMDAHEWLVLPSGRILKADAVEHSRAHDLIGRQDPAWDLAGAAVELDLSPEDVDRLLRALRDAAGRSIDASALAFYRLAYLAFRAAQAELQREALRERWPDDALRMARARDRYREHLSRALR